MAFRNPVGLPRHECQRVVGFAEPAIDLERPLGRCLRLRHRIAGGKVRVAREQPIGVGQPRIGGSVGRIFPNCLLEVGQPFRQAVLRPLVPVEPTLQVGLVRFRVLGRSLDEPLLVLAGQPQAKVLDGVSGDGLVQREDCAERLLVVTAPDDAAVLRVDELNADRHVTASFLDPTGQHRGNIQLPANLLRVHYLVLVAGCARAGNNPLETRQLG
jgi:hypothetical protein